MERNQKTHNPLDIDTQALTPSAFMTRVYQWMTIGILLTAIVSTYIGLNPELSLSIAQNKTIFIGCFVLQILTVLVLGAAIKKLSSAAAIAIFLLYSILTGVTFSTIFLVYTHASIQSAFFVTAFGFLGLTIFGYITKKDLGPIGTFCSMGLFGLVGLSILSWFFPSMMGGSFGTFYNFAGLLIFAGLTAYDTQKIKLIGEGTMSSHQDQSKFAILGALTLYLDFVNLFLIILRMNGKQRN